MSLVAMTQVHRIIYEQLLSSAGCLSQGKRHILMLDVDVNAILHGSDAGCGNRAAKIGHRCDNCFHNLKARVLLLRQLPRITRGMTSVEI